MENGINTETANVPRIVIAGGGIAAFEAVLALRALAADRVNIDVWTPEQDFVHWAQSVAVPFMRGRGATIPARPARGSRPAGRSDTGASSRSNPAAMSS